MRIPLMAGNWKMYKSPQETRQFFADFAPAVANAVDREIVICPPFVDLAAALEATKSTRISIGAQNLHWAKEGAYTGEISGAMIRAIGCDFVIIGHSERRQYFGETNETVLKRTRAALTYDLTPIICVGERLEERESGRTNDVLTEQFRDGVKALGPEEFSRVVIAYEPVWAIGTGKTATPQIAQDAHSTIRGLVRDAYGKELADSVRILYGGSVKPDNVKDLMSAEDIDGTLVGGASLDPKSFASIVNF